MDDGKTILELCRDLMEMFKELRRDWQQEQREQRIEKERVSSKRFKQKKQRKQKQQTDGGRREKPRPKKNKTVDRKKKWKEFRTMINKTDNQLNQRGKNLKVGGQLGGIIKNLKRRKKRRERGWDWSYKVRYKEEEEGLNILGWNSKENG